MAVNDYDKVLAKERFHRRCLYGIHTNGDEALPEISSWERMGTGRVDDSLWHLNGVDDFRGLNTGGGRRSRMSDDGHGLSQRGIPSARRDARQRVRGKQVQYGQVLGDEYAIKALKAERTFSIQKVGDMCLLKICSPGQGRTGQESAINSPQDFQAKILVKSIERHILTIA